jgi:UDP-glucose 4-epimerase
MRVLVAGGAGFIGSHACLELAAQGHDVVIVDNFANSSPSVVSRLESVAGVPMPAHNLDVRDRDGLAALFRRGPIDAVVHFAALKSVGDSWSEPLEFFDNNIAGTITLLKAMRDAGVGKFIFSSSCTVYGAPESTPVDEDASLHVASPYGRTKLVVEEMLQDIARADPGFRFASLRYFNPAGAHPSGRVGEDPRGSFFNLMPILCQVAVGKRDGLDIFGTDWPTPDGTCVRDYIHVVDLARAHVGALDFLVEKDRNLAVNVGTGRGFSVREIVRTFERETGRSIPCREVGRREGDFAAVWADPSLAGRELGWRAELDLAAMCRDAWRWQVENPDGYDS